MAAIIQKKGRPARAYPQILKPQNKNMAFVWIFYAYSLKKPCPGTALCVRFQVLLYATYDPCTKVKGSTHTATTETIRPARRRTLLYIPAQIRYSQFRPNRRISSLKGPGQLLAAPFLTTTASLLPNPWETPD